MTQAPGVSSGRSEILLGRPLAKRTYWQLAISRIYIFITTEKSIKFTIFLTKVSVTANREFFKKLPPRKMHVARIHVHYSK